MANWHHRWPTSPGTILASCPVALRDAIDQHSEKDCHCWQQNIVELADDAERPMAPKSAISSGVKQHKAATTMPMTPVATSRLSDMHERIVARRLTGLSILRHPSVIGSLCPALERPAGGRASRPPPIGPGRGPKFKLHGHSARIPLAVPATARHPVSAVQQ